MKWRVIALLLGLALVSCSALSALTVADMGQAWGDNATCTTDSLRSGDLSLVNALYPDLGWTAYAQSAPLMIASDVLPSRKVEASVLSFLGESERIAFFPVLSGRLPHGGESDVCALDKDSAFRLFGSIDPGEVFIRLYEKPVLVTGVIDIDRPLVLLPATLDGVFDRLVVDDRDALITLMTALGIEPDPFDLSGTEFARFAWLLCALPWLLAAMLVLIELRKRGKGWRIIVAMLLWIVILGLFLLIVACVPVRLLPARWSDFAFYGEQIEAWKVRPFRVPDVRDSLLRSDVIRVVLLSVMACIALWTERMWLRCGKSR